MKDVERLMIFQALKYYDGNRTHAALSLGISLRTIREKIKRYREQGYEV